MCGDQRLRAQGMPRSTLSRWVSWADISTQVSRPAGLTTAVDSTQGPVGSLQSLYSSQAQAKAAHQPEGLGSKALHLLSLSTPQTGYQVFMLVLCRKCHQGPFTLKSSSKDRGQEDTTMGRNKAKRGALAARHSPTTESFSSALPSWQSLRPDSCYQAVLWEGSLPTRKQKKGGEGHRK